MEMRVKRQHFICAVNSLYAYSRMIYILFGSVTVFLQLLCVYDIIQNTPGTRVYSSRESWCFQIGNSLLGIDFKLQSVYRGCIFSNGLFLSQRQRCSTQASTRTLVNANKDDQREA